MRHEKSIHNPLPGSKQFIIFHWYTNIVLEMEKGIEMRSGIRFVFLFITLLI